MEHEPAPRTDRRGFLQAGALATASALTLGRGADAQDAPAKDVVLPRRPLGKTGIDITQCSLPCQASFPSNPPMQASRQHTLAKAVTTAFFESTLGRSSTARCFLRKGLARENPDDVRVSLRGPRR